MVLTKADLERIWENRYVENSIDEMLGLLKHVEELNPLQVVLEIGVCYGGSLRLWEQLVPPGGVVIAIDKHPDIAKRLTGEIKEAHSGLGNDWEIEERIGASVLKLKSDREIYVILLDSASPEAGAAVEYFLDGREIDFFFHDGIHYGPGPIHDYVNYQHLFRTGGLLCIGDVSGITQHAPVPNLGTQVLYHALPEPKIPATRPHVNGMAVWWKQEGFVLDAPAVIEQGDLSYSNPGPTGGSWQYYDKQK